MARKAAKDRDGVEAEGPRLLLNSDARNGIIVDAIRFVKAKRGEIKTLQQELREYVNKHIKGDLGYKVSDFQAVMRLTDLEGDDQTKFFDTLRETFLAAGYGTQLNFLDAVEKTNGKGAKASADSEDDEDTIFAAGRTAGLAGQSANVNPHRKGTAAQKSFHAGWINGQAQLAKGIGKANGAGATAH